MSSSSYGSVYCIMLTTIENPGPTPLHLSCLLSLGMQDAVDMVCLIFRGWGEFGERGGACTSSVIDLKLGVRGFLVDSRAWDLDFELNV